MASQEEIDAFIVDLITENCMECQQFLADESDSPCMCDIIADVVLCESESENDNDEKPYVDAWEHYRSRVREETYNRRLQILKNYCTATVDETNEKCRNEIRTKLEKIINGGN